MTRDLKTVTILFRAQAAFSDRIKKDIGQYGISVTAFGVLEALYHKGSLSVQAVTDKVLIASSSMSYVLDVLEKKGYIERQVAESDKRRVMVSLTQPGETFMNAVYPRHKHNLRNALDVLTEKEETTLKQLLKKIGKSAEQH